MRNGRGQPWETVLQAVDKVGKSMSSRTPYGGVTSADVAHRSSTGCGQEFLDPITGARVVR